MGEIAVFACVDAGVIDRLFQMHGVAIDGAIRQGDGVEEIGVQKGHGGVRSGGALADATGGRGA
jgi:hypothetical protein